MISPHYILVPGFEPGPEVKIWSFAGHIWAFDSCYLQQWYHSHIYLVRELQRKKTGRKDNIERSYQADSDNSFSQHLKIARQKDLLQCSTTDIAVIGECRDINHRYRQFSKGWFAWHQVGIGLK